MSGAARKGAQFTTEAEVIAALARKYPSPEWAFFPHVRDATGFGGSRTADAIAMSLWPSRGLELHGFEVKVSRSDWMREKKNPEKAEEVAQYCDRWWLVVGDATIVSEGELPDGWGLLVPGPGGLVVRQAAGALREKAPAIPRHFVASLLRAATDGLIPKGSIEATVKAARSEGYNSGLSTAEQRIASAQDDRDAAQKAVRDFEAASGVRIDAWQLGAIGKAVQSIVNGGRERALHDATVLRKSTERLLELARAAESELSALTEKEPC